MRPGTLPTAIVCFLALCLGAAPASAQTVQLTPFGGQAYDLPYYVHGGAGDGSRVYVVEAPGYIQLVKDGETQPTPFLDISADVFDGGERGLFSMALAPDYASSGLFYVFYTRDDTGPGQHYLRIEEFRRSASDPDIADPTTRRIVMEIPHLTAGNHNGGQLQFGPDDLLYIATGDGGDTPNAAQDLTSRLGKLLRIDPRGAAPFQYSIPADNPFADGAGPLADEVYSYGLRNPYRFSFDRYTGDLIIGDVGQVDKEELDFRNEGNGRGVNFGWPCFEGTEVNSTSGPCSPTLMNHTPPVFEYRTGNGLGMNAAVNAGYVIRDPALPDFNGLFEYTDTYFDLPGVRTVRLTESGSSGDATTGLNPADQVFSSGQDACGHIYIANFGAPGSGGAVDRIEPTTGPYPCKVAPVMDATAPDYQAMRAAGAVPVSINCDVDCTATATGTITFTETYRKFNKKKKKKTTRTRQATLTPAGSTERMQLNGDTLLLPLGSDQRSRLSRAVGTVRVSVSVTARGAGGGAVSDTAGSESQAPKPKKKKKKRKKKKKKR